MQSASSTIISSPPGRASLRAPVMEVFASIQGEGLYAGEPQVFLRLRGCPLRCRWCDTKSSWGVPSSGHDSERGVVASVRRANSEANGDPGDPGRFEIQREPAWASPFQIAMWLGAAEPGEPRTLSVTGGEPLIWADFLVELKPFLGERRVHLETAGAHPNSLERVLDVVDHVSLDLKLEADLDPPVDFDGATESSPRTETEWQVARRACLALVAERDACCKLVVVGGRHPHEFEQLLLDHSRIAPKLPLFLQPVTKDASHSSGVEAPEEALLTALVETARDLGLTVRVMPQIHRSLRLP